MNIDPSLDLVMRRETHVPVELVWKAWTTPELLKQWFTPKPWITSHVELNLFPGGKFVTVMEGPDGERFEGEGCILEVHENRKLVWTSGLLGGYRPIVRKGIDTSSPEFYFTAIIEMEPSATGTKYTATLVHGDPEARTAHDGMGFETGWGAAFDQLVELMSKV